MYKFLIDNGLASSAGGSPGMRMNNTEKFKKSQSITMKAVEQPKTDAVI